MGERYLIIHADDYGMCRETNACIEELFKRECITSASVMTVGDFAGEAMKTSLNNGFDIGVHVTLNSDWKNRPWNSTEAADKVPSLVNDRGFFYDDLNDFFTNALEEEVEMEIRAQYHFFTDRKITPTHMDSHSGTLYGMRGRSFLKEAFMVCKEFQLPFRFPKKKDFLHTMFQGAIPKEINEAHSKAVTLAEDFGVALIDNMITNPFSMKEIACFDSLKNFYINTVKNLKEGITEVFLHPSYDALPFRNVTAEWQKRVWEYELLLDEDFKKVLDDEKVKLVSWGKAPFYNGC
ncbi:polysaccharide deacetylase family protein [Bacillaceae bacterium Marseille-Q3522]|nr:polysaccharide deacetylase family protein [Bacillaceae bacterium Marseille-Q3522]